MAKPNCVVHLLLKFFDKNDNSFVKRPQMLIFNFQIWFSNISESE